MSNGWCVAIVSDMVKLKSVYFAKDIHKFKFLKICLPRKHFFRRFLPFGYQIVTPEEKEKYTYLKIFYE